MIVIGAKGFAKEILEVLVSKKYGYNEKNLFFFDNVNKLQSKKIFDKYLVLSSYKDLENPLSKTDNYFCFGIGNPKHRKLLGEEFVSRGWSLQTIISQTSSIGRFNTTIGEGTTIIGNAQITNSVTIGKGCLIYMNTSIAHDVSVGEFVELSPGVILTGNCTIGDFTSLGAGTIVLPKIKIGRNCIIGSGTVVTKDIPDNSMVVGVPGKVIKTLPYFE